MAVVTTNLGTVTAYGDAVAAGYTGTKEQWQALMANYATVGQQATQSAQTASTAATTATTAAQIATTKASEASASAMATEQAAASISTPDTTLTQSGKAADAKATGDKISEIKEDFNDKVNSAYVTDSASGSVAHFVDGADGVPMKSVKVNIAPVQSGSGDPSPDNVRPITGWEAIKIYHSGADTEEATEYEISLTSAGTVYGGTIDAVSGELTVDREYVPMTAELWKVWNDSVKAAYTDGVYQNREITVCDSLKAGELVTNGIKVRTTDGRIGALPQWAESCTTIAEFKTALANNPAINIVITLANPQTYQLTPTEVKSLLGINNVWSDAGDMNVEYRADMKLYIDKRLGV